MDPATAVVAAAIIAAVASIITTIISVSDRRKVKETHHQVTKNGGTSNPPTVLDKLADIKTELQLVKETQIAQDVKLDVLWQQQSNNSKDSS